MRTVLDFCYFFGDTLIDGGHGGRDVIDFVEKKYLFDEIAKHAQHDDIPDEIGNSKDAIAALFIGF